MNSHIFSFGTGKNTLVIKRLAIGVPVSCLILFFGALVLTSCTKQESTNSAPSKPQVVRVAYPPIVASLPLVIAQEEKLFATNEIHVESTLFVNSNDMLNSLIAGRTDFLPAVSLIPIIQLEIQYPGKVRVFSHSRMRPEKAFDGIIVKEDSLIRALSDLAGKKIGVFPGTSASNMLKAFLKKHGIINETVSLIQLAPPAQLASLQSGAVDALFTYEPVTTTALKNGGYRSLFGSVYGDLLNPCPIGSAVIARSFERSHPEAAKSAIRAYDQAIGIERSQPEKSKALIQSIIKTPPEITAAVNVVDVTLSTEIDIPNLQKLIDLLYEIGEIPEKINAERLVAPTQQ